MENLDLDSLTKVVGGRYCLVSLMQKRMRELQLGYPPLTEESEDLQPFEIVAEEIRQEKIWLVTGESADKLRKVRVAESIPRIAPPAQPNAGSI